MPSLQNALNWRQIPMMGVTEEQFILIRPYRRGDEEGSKIIARESIMSSVSRSFFTALTREITFEVIIIMSAFMFVFVGLTPKNCLLSIPVTVFCTYLSIYLSHIIWASCVNDELSDIQKHILCSPSAGFWVAEAYEFPREKREPSELKYPILNESQLNGVYKENKLFCKKIIGTVAVERNRFELDCARIRRLAVSAKYQRKGVANALLDVALNFCEKKGYDIVVLTASECQEAARKLFVKKGFELRQMYHKQMLLSVFQSAMYEFSHRFPKVKTVSYI